MKRMAIWLWSGLLISVFACSNVWAQATAQISGTVRDQTGAVLPGVEVTATHIDTGIARTTVTNETGSYVLPSLAIGPYRLEAGLPGFRTFVQTGIVLQVNSNPAINPILEVGQVTEQVEVQANAALVETRTSGVGQVIENQRILELPLNGRNVTDLITLSGAAVSLGGESFGGRDFGGSPRLQIAGGMTTAVGYSLDGADYSNTMSISGLPMPFPDALQEFKVETSGVTAQASKGSGVSAVTKSGTNDVHGDLFEFVRNDLFNARSYFAAKGSTLKRNQFGGTLGGPIRKNKLFFFGGYQGTTVRQDPADLEAFLPTPAMLSGDWTAFASPACNAGRPLTLRAPFVNNRIGPASYSRAALNIVNRVLAAAPTPTNDCGSVRYGIRTPENDWQTVGRIDYQWTEKHSIFGRYTASHLYQRLPFGLTPTNVLTSATEGNDNLIQSFALGDTFLIGANTVNALRFSANRMFNRQLGTNDAAGGKFWTSCDVGINMYCGDTPGRSRLAVTSGFTIGTLHDSKDAVWINAFQINDELGLVRGTHQISLGGSMGLAYSGVRDRYYGTGQFNINGQTTGHGLADLMTGRVSQYTDAAEFYFSTRQWSPRLYATDTWKAAQKLTLTYGLRWDPFLPAISPAGQVANFNYDRFKQGIRSTVFPNAPAGAYYPGDPGFPGKSGARNRWWQFAPRVGLAWDVSGDGRTSVRASYALAYAVVGTHWYETPAQSAPWSNTTSVVNTSLDDPWSVFPGGNPFPLVKGKTFTPFGEFYSTPYDLHNPNTSSWNLSIQRQIGTWLVSAAYLGSQTAHAWYGQSINPATYFSDPTCTLNGVTYTPCSSLTNTSQRRKLYLERPQDGQFIGNASQVDDGGTGNYHGMLLTVQRQAGRNLTINGNYTWSHCLGDLGVDVTSVNNGNNQGYNNLNNRAYDRGDCNGDRRQIFNVTTVAQTPQFANPMLRRIATGWTLSGIYRRLSGSPLTVLAGSDRAMNGILSANGTGIQRGTQILGSAYSDQSGAPFTNWFNRTAFDLPAVGTLGNVGRNSVVGPPTWSFDLALSRGFRFRESQRLEFRAEAFNVTNSFRPGSPNVTLTSAQFGQLRTSFDPRILQFALKYVF